MSNNSQVGFQSWNESSATSTSKNNGVDSLGNGVARVAPEKRTDPPPATIRQSGLIERGQTMADLSLYSAGTADPQSESKISVFSFQGREVRTVTENNEIFFVGKDVCERLGYSNATDAMNRHCKGVVKRYPLLTAGGEQLVRVLTESDVMRLICSSQLPEAEKFEKWVFEEVLPSIRRDGGYIAARPEETLEELCLRTNNALMAAIERQKAQIAAQDRQLKLQAPDVEYCHTVLSSSSLMTVNTIAAHLGVSAKRLNAFLDGEGWIYRQGRNWCPSAKIRDCGYCDYQTVPYVNRDGEDCTAYHLKWTEPGRRAVIALWNKRHNTNISEEVR